MTDRHLAYQRAALANARLAERDPDRAREIEWYVTPGGDLRLRDKAEYVRRRQAELSREMLAQKDFDL